MDVVVHHKVSGSHIYKERFDQELPNFRWTTITMPFTASGQKLSQETVENAASNGFVTNSFFFGGGGSSVLQAPPTGGLLV